jgi:hypothetical protein
VSDLSINSFCPSSLTILGSGGVYICGSFVVDGDGEVLELPDSVVLDDAAQSALFAGGPPSMWYLSDVLRVFLVPRGSVPCFFRKLIPISANSLPASLPISPSLLLRPRLADLFVCVCVRCARKPGDSILPSTRVLLKRLLIERVCGIC